MQERLEESWGDKAQAQAMNCKAYERWYDPFSRWQCYIFASNPADPDEIACLISGFDVEITEWRRSELEKRYNSIGDPPTQDLTFKPREVRILFKHICKGYL